MAEETKPRLVLNPEWENARYEVYLKAGDKRVGRSIARYRVNDDGTLSQVPEYKQIYG